MPILKIDRIVSFSSEDKVHTASNILGNNAALRWKCKLPGEKHATLVLQLEKASVIIGIDIGNEHSSYIEVLVSRSGDDADFKTLLPMSSFMSAIESRQSTDINRVRMFKQNDLLKPECEEKWDRIKIVCTQPFNKHVQYGLSFIKFHTNEVRTSDVVKETVETFGGFHLRPDSPNEFRAGYLFAKRKESADDKSSTNIAAAIRASNSSLLNGTSNSPLRSPRLLPELLKNSEKRNRKQDMKSDIILKPRHRDELFYSEEDDKPNAKIDKLMENRNALRNNKKTENSLQLPKKQKIRNQEGNVMETSKTPMSKRSQDNQHAQEMASSSKKESNKRKSLEKNQISPKKIKISKITKPFNKLLEDVVIVISGIQNPARAHIREKAVEMGAKYKPDWDNTSTHLVCAFMNTPKFNQVKGKGKIVTRHWVEECYSQKKKIPWRRFALDKNETNKVESEDEVSEESKDSKLFNQKNNYSSQIIDLDTMELASDTEETIDRIQNFNSITVDNKKGKTSENETTSNSPISTVPQGDTVDPFLIETDTDEETNTRKEQIKNKPFDFFKQLTFYIDNNFDDCILDMLKNYIFIHEGTLFDDPKEDVIYIICGKDEAPNLKEINSNAICILPDWIVDCHKCRQFIPPDEYFVL